MFTDDGATDIEDQIKFIRIFPTFVQEDEKECFLDDFTLAEIESVLKGFKKDKSLSPDGWPVELFLHFFDLVDLDILTTVDQSRGEGRVSGALNATFITLIPNVASHFHLLTSGLFPYATWFIRPSASRLPSN